MSRRVLLVGGAGTIGSGFAEWARERYELGVLDLPGRATPSDGIRIHEADLRDLDALKRAFGGYETIVHLGGERLPSATWSSLLPTNIVGTYHVVAAAIAAGCAHVVYASSVHAVSGDPARSAIREDEPVRPADLYGVTKCFGEALGSLVADTTALAFTALRIGAFRSPEDAAKSDAGWMLRDYCAPDDLYQLLALVIDQRPPGYSVYNAVSGNTFGRLSIEKAVAELGYRPQYDAFQLAGPFADAVAAVGGLGDKPFLSGLREDIAPILDEEHVQ